jgi:hypothetical protein
MRLSTVAYSLLALGIVVSAQDAAQGSAAGLQSRDATPSRDFARKMEVRSKKHGRNSRGEQIITNGMMTWYGGGQLDNPACGGKTPSKWDHVVAVKEGGKFKCGDTVHLHHNNKMVEAKVVDYCAGCDENHVDATQGLFSKLADLDQGVVKGMHIKIIPN